MKIAILGYGTEGKSAERYFIEKGHEVQIFTDFKPEDIPGFHLENYDMVLRSPSVRPLAEASWSSLTQYFFAHCPCPIIGVTGTKGKGTTCSMITALLKSLGRTVYLVGNIGTPSIEVLNQLKPDDIIVYEMSSFQLWDLKQSPHVAVVLRIEPDHLDVHTDFEEYVGAKSHIVTAQTSSDFCIYYDNNPFSQKIAQLSPGEKYPYPSIIAQNDEKVKAILDCLTIPGAHNRENATAALLAVYAYLKSPEQSLDDFLGQHSEAFCRALQDFRGLPHRLQFVRELDGVKYYDDNYSAAFPAMDVAIKAFADQSVVLIAGGKDRHLDLTKAKRTIFDAPNIAKVILIGETKYTLADGENPAKYQFAETLAEAVDFARTAALQARTEHGSAIVLMSPGAASFDMFKNFGDRGDQFQKIVMALSQTAPSSSVSTFRFLDYAFDPATYVASFRYVGADGTEFTERVQFAKSEYTPDQELLSRALFLAFVLIGTSYYKAHPTRRVELSRPIDSFQAKFFSTVYQDGLSQFAFENQLSRQNLAHFVASETETQSTLSYDGSGILSLQSGGKDSLLTATLLGNAGKPWTAWYLGSNENHPAVLDNLGAPLQTATRTLDLSALKQTGGMNGHVPVTYIVQSLALIQAILNHQNTVVTSIGREGNEPSHIIDDPERPLPVNHQWSKTWVAEQLFSEYVARYISPDLRIGSPLRGFSELRIAELFAELCWNKYGHQFSSCNVANYRQKQDNRELRWCGHCAKCANSFLLFAPLLPPTELNTLFPNGDLFAEPALTDIFKGLLGVDNYAKPFECVGEIAELRRAYHMKKPGFADLPFAVPESDFDYRTASEMQPFFKGLIG